MTSYTPAPHTGSLNSLGFNKAPAETRMLLQVHDELIFEAPEDEVEKTLAVVTKTMQAAPGIAAGLTVPLLVEAQAADTWGQAH